MTPTGVWLLRTALWVAVAVLVWVLAIGSVAAQIPPDAAKYKRDLIRNARLIWGLDAPTATFAGQIHQESAPRAWRSSCRRLPSGSPG